MSERVWVCVCVRDGRPGPISLVVAANTPWPPQSLQEGTSLLPQLPQIKGSFVIWLHHPCPPLPALKIQSPFLTSHSPAPYPLPLPVCRGSSTDLLLSLPQGSLVVLSSVSFAYGLPKSIHGSGPVLVGSVLFCPVIHSSGFYPGESLPLESLGSSLSLPLLSLSLLSNRPPPPESACLTLLVCPSLPPFPNYQSLVSSLELPTSPRPHHSLYLCSPLLPAISYAAAVTNVAWIRSNCTSQPATGATREESHFGRLSKFSDRRRGRIALQIGTVSEASPHPPSPGYPITQPSQPAIIPPPKGPV